MWEEAALRQSVGESVRPGVDPDFFTLHRACDFAVQIGRHSDEVRRWAAGIAEVLSAREHGHA